MSGAYFSDHEDDMPRAWHRLRMYWTSCWERLLRVWESRADAITSALRGLGRWVARVRDALAWPAWRARLSLARAALGVALALAVPVGLPACTGGSADYFLDLVDYDRDSFAFDVDCDDRDPDIGPGYYFYPDRDLDGYGVYEGAQLRCEEAPGWSPYPTDCDDNNGFAWAAADFYVDGDKDGYGIGEVQTLCTSVEAGYAVVDGDCEDGDPDVYPDAPTTCDGVDQDCNGYGECDPPEGTGAGASAALVVTGVLDASAGSALGGAGDVDGDGIADLLIGVPRYAVGDDEVGAVALVYGGTTGTVTLGSESAGVLLIVGFNDGDQTGAAVAGGVDLDQDGYDDFVIGAPGADEAGGIFGGGDDGGGGGAFPMLGPWGDGSETGGDTEAGKVYFVRGGPLGEGTLELQDAAFRAAMAGPEGGGRLGASLACSADYTGDGVPDCAAGAPTYTPDGGEEQAGGVFVFNGLPRYNRDAEDLAWGVIEGGTAYEQLGASVAGNCDIDTDGEQDLVLGAPTDYRPDLLAGSASLSETQVGHAYIVTSRRAGTLNIADLAWTWLAGEAQDGTGLSVSCGGDVDGDGYDDVAVGAPYANERAGEVALISGAVVAAMTPGTPLDDAARLATITGETAGDDLGASVTLVADVGEDGYAELLVGAPGVNSSRGAALLFYGPINSDLSRSDVDYAVYGEVSNDRIGLVVVDPGDVTGLGWSDLLIGGVPLLDDVAPGEVPDDEPGQALLVPTDAF